MLRASRASAHLFLPTRSGQGIPPQNQISHMSSEVDRLVPKPIFGSRSRYRFAICCLVRRVFPRRLHHEVPSWVDDGALFHIRIAQDRERQQSALVDPLLASALLDSAKFYEVKQRWHITLFLLMPDHVHALLSFA